MREWAFHMLQLCLWRIVWINSDNMPTLWKATKVEHVEFLVFPEV